MIKRLLEEELHHEIRLLNDLEEKLSSGEIPVLSASKKGLFYYLKDKSGKAGKRKYIRKNDRSLLRLITGHRYLQVKAKRLAHNIKILETAVQRIVDYDDPAIMDALPKSYASAISYLRDTESEKEIFQSENPKNRHMLAITSSTGVKVRSKDELALYETLIEYDLTVYYEKKLSLEHRELKSDGTIQKTTVDVYPDFTIVLPDNSEIYWEISGMFGTAGYRQNQFQKFCDYYDNGIYMPKNLIITMEDPDKPLDIIAIRHIIESQILPRTKEY